MSTRNGPGEKIIPMNHIHFITDKKALARAGTRDLIALEPLPGNPPIVKELWVLEVIAAGLIAGEMIHIHGETGTAKNALIEALSNVPENWEALCAHLGEKHLPLKVYPIEMATFETISELHSRRALNQGQTYDEPSSIVKAVQEAARLIGSAYPVIWLREIGRTPTASVQGGLLNLMTKGLILIDGDKMISGANIAWLADSNYHTDDSSTHILVVQDDALQRRWTVNLMFDYLTPEQDIEILRFHKQHGFLPDVSDECITQVVKLGASIRERRKTGALASLAPPTLYGYAAFLRAFHRHPRLNKQEIAEATLAGSATVKDLEDVRGLFAEAFAVTFDEKRRSGMLGG